MSIEMIDEVIEKMKETASTASKEYNKSDDENHSFMLGYIMSSFGHLLRDLELTESQLKLLAEFN